MLRRNKIYSFTQISKKFIYLNFQGEGRAICGACIYNCSKSTIVAPEQYGYISSKLIIKTPERRHLRRSAVVLLSLLLTLNGSHISSDVFIVNFNQLSAGWVHSQLQILPNLFELCNYFQYLSLAGSYYIRNC